MSQSLTAGFLYNGPTGKTTDLRVNYATDRTNSTTAQDTYGGASLLPFSVVLPASAGTNGSYDLSVIGATGYAINGYRKNTDGRIDLEDSNAILMGSHEYKIGFDVRRISSVDYNMPYTANVIFNGVASTLDGSLLSGDAVNSIVNLNVPKVYPVYLQMGAFVQDTWKASNELTVTFGARYDINPAPRAGSGPNPYALDGAGFLNTTLPLYLTQWKNISPRASAAYQISGTPGHEMVARGGFGWFYDTSPGSINSAFHSAPYQSLEPTDESGVSAGESSGVSAGNPAVRGGIRSGLSITGAADHRI